MEYLGNDIAVVHAVGRGGVPLPLGIFQSLTAFTSLGWLNAGQPEDEPFPVSGHIIGNLAKVVCVSGDREFDLINVAVLGDGHIDVGLSGAPLFDPTNGVAIGLIVAKRTRNLQAGTGFAVRFDSESLIRSPRLRSLFDRNAQTVSAGGDFLNAPGISLLIRSATDAAIKRLVAQGVFLPDQFVTRQTADKQLTDFESADERILPLVGRSGTGKTSLLARYASTRPDVLFMAAADLPNDSIGIHDAVHRALQSASSGPACPTDLRTFIEALRRLRRPMLVLLDGLNELPDALGARARQWLNNVAADLAQGMCRLMLTSRPEYWDAIRHMFPKRMVRFVKPDKDDQPPAAFELGDFDNFELEAAVERYHLSTRVDDLPLLRHPLMCRLASLDNVTDPGISGPVLLESFVSRKCALIAQSDSMRLNVRTIRDFANEIARELLTTGRPAIGRERLVAVLGDIAVRDAMLREHLLIEGVGGLRFVFDEASEYLQGAAEVLDRPDAPLSIDRLCARNDAMADGAIAYALAGLDPVDDATTLYTALAYVLSFREPGTSRHFRRILRVLRGINDVRPVTSRVEALFKEFASDFVESRLLERMLALLGSLAIEDRIRLALMIVPTIEDSYGAEPKHWRDLQYEFDNATVDSDELKATLRDWTTAEPDSAVRTLATHFDDRTPFKRPGAAEVRHYAARVVYAVRDRLPLRVLGELCKIENATGVRTVVELVEVAPNRMADVVLHLLEEDTSVAAVAAATRIVYRMHGLGILGPLRDRLLAALRPLLDHPTLSIRNTILIAIAPIEDDTAAFEKRLLTAFEHGEVPVYEITRLFPNHLSQMLKELDRRLTLDVKPSFEDMQALGSFRGKVEQHHELFNWLSGILARTTNASYSVARVVEDQICAGMAAGHENVLLNLCDQIIKSGSDSAINCLIYTSFSDRDRQPAPFLTQLRAQLSTSAIPNDCLSLLIRLCVRGRREIPEVEQLVEALSSTFAIF